MKLQRRRFLGLTTGACIGTGCTAGGGSSSVEPTAAAGDRWDEIRAQFDQDPAYANFAGFLLAPHPRPVREAIARHRDALDRNPAVVLDEQLALMVAGKPNNDALTRTAAAEFIGENPEDIALTDSTTMGLGLVYSGIRVAAGKEIVVGSHGHYSTHEALRLRAARDGVGVRTVDLYAAGAKVTVDEVVSNVRREVKDGTRVVGVTWVHSSTGVKLPIRAIADALVDINRSRESADRVILVVDGVHGFGVEDVSMADLGCDVFIAGGHKWLFGPRGTGIVWARPEIWTEIVPTIPAFEAPPFFAWMRGEPPVGPGGLMNSPGGFHSFEHRWALADAFAFQTSIGRADIQARVHELNGRLKEGMRAIPKIRLHTPMERSLSSGLVCFEVEGRVNEQVVEQLLGRKIIASVSPYRVAYVRLAAGLLTTSQQVDDALGVLSEMA